MSDDSKEELERRKLELEIEELHKAEPRFRWATAVAIAAALFAVATPLVVAYIGWKINETISISENARRDLDTYQRLVLALDDAKPAAREGAATGLAKYLDRHDLCQSAFVILIRRIPKENDTTVLRLITDAVGEHRATTDMIVDARATRYYAQERLFDALVKSARLYYARDRDVRKALNDLDSTVGQVGQDVQRLWPTVVPSQTEGKIIGVIRDYRVRDAVRSRGPATVDPAQLGYRIKAADLENIIAQVRFMASDVLLDRLIHAARVPECP